MFSNGFFVLIFIIYLFVYLLKRKPFQEEDIERDWIIIRQTLDRIHRDDSGSIFFSIHIYLQSHT